MFCRIFKNIVFMLKKKKRLYYFGDFSTWGSAEKRSKKYGNAYQSDHILLQVSSATQKVRKGEGLYEQDGVVYYKENNDYELLASLLYVYSKTNRLNVIDFGGALGSTFFRYRKLLEQYCCKWTIVEQKHFVDYGKENIPEICFKYKITDRDKDVDVILSSSCLGYLDDPYGQLRSLMEQNVPYMIINGSAFSPNDKDRIMLQHVPASIYKAVYPIRLFSLTKFKRFIKENEYEIVWEWDHRFGNIPIYNGWGLSDTIEKGFLLKHR